MPKSVLVIDDDEDFRQRLAEVLQTARYHVLEAADGQEASALADKLNGAIDLMIVDLCLPRINGFEFIGSVTRRKSNIKIIATSSIYKDSFLDMATGMGADVALRKPQRFNGDLWLTTVRRLIGKGDQAEAAGG